MEARRPSPAKKPQPPQASGINLAAKFIQDWIDIWFPRSGLPGLTIAIRNKDGLVMNRSWGYANLKTKEEMTPKHIFRVASQSKMFTATGIALLKERRQLSFDDPAAKYLPWLKKKPGMESVTIRQLLGHAAGLARDGDQPGFWLLNRPFPNEKSLRRNTRRIDSPESVEGIKYSNWGYALLGKIIEAASGKSYDAFMKDEIIKPLGLRRTTPDYKPGLKGSIAAGYEQPWYGKRTRENLNIPADTQAPAAGFCGTPADMSRFVLGQAQPGRDVIGARSKQELRKHFNDIALAADESYGMGRERIMIGRHLVVGHGGTFPGHKTSSAASSDLGGLSVSVAINSADGKPTGILKNIFRTIFYFAEHGMNPGAGANRNIGGLYNTRWAGFDGKTGMLAVTDLWDYDPQRKDDDPTKEFFACPQTGPKTFRITGDGGFGNEGENIVFATKNGRQTMKYASWTPFVKAP